MQRRTLKVLMVTESFRTGGKERRLLELLKSFANTNEIECEIVMFKNIIGYDEVKKLPYKIHLIERKVKKDITGVFRLAKIYRSFKPEIVHSWGGMTSVYAIPLARLFGIKTINGMITNSSPVKPFNENWNRSRLTFPFSTVILSNSKAGLKAYNAPERKSKVIHNGFNYERIKTLISKEKIRKQFKINTVLVVGMVAAISERKDHRTFIEAAIHVLRRNTKVSFLIIGDGQERSKLEESVPEEFSEKIRFLGNQSNIESLVQTFTIGVLASNHKVAGEGISNSIMEYMVLGKPVIATRGGGNAEIIEDGKTGYLVDGGSADQLSERIDDLLCNPGKCLLFGQAGAEKIKREFTIQKMSRSFYELYSDLVK